jgi:hypothetical protein
MMGDRAARHRHGDPVRVRRGRGSAPEATGPRFAMGKASHLLSRVYGTAPTLHLCTKCYLLVVRRRKRTEVFDFAGRPSGVLDCPETDLFFLCPPLYT